MPRERAASSTSWSRPGTIRRATFERGRWRKLGTFLDLRSRVNDPNTSGRRTGPPGPGLPSRLPAQRPLLRRLHARGPGRGGRGHGHRRVPPCRCRARRPCVPSARHDHRPAVPQSQRRAPRLRAGWLPVHRLGRRRQRRRSPWQRAAPGHAPRQAPAHRPPRPRWGWSASLPRAPLQPAGRSGRARRDLGLGPAQPVALLLRPSDRRPLDRRRRAGHHRRGRPLAGGQQRYATRARASTTAGTAARAVAGSPPRAASAASGRGRSTTTATTRTAAR